MTKSLKIYIGFIIGIFLTSAVSAQEKDPLFGRVLNDAGQAIDQVSISISGGGDPVFTNENGEFSIERTEAGNWLIVKPVNDYHEKQILLKDQDSVTIYLSRLTLDSRYDDIALSGGDVQRRNIIGSFKTLELEHFDKQPFTSAGQYIQGKVSGAHVINNSGMPGSGTTLFLRGYSSLLSNNQPLYVVDGIPLENSNLYTEIIEGFNYNPLSTIDPLDISEFTILKDAEATALYGMKGANGVIYIKTLEPKETRTTINLSLRTGLTLKPNSLPQLNATQYKHLANELLFSSGINEEEYRLDYPGLFYTQDDDEYITYRHNTNWQDEVYTNALMQNAHLSIKGGDAIAKYGLSVSFLDSEGVFKNTSLNRINIRLVGAFDVFSWLKMNIASNLTTNTTLIKESGISARTSPVLSSLFKSPMLNPYEYDSEKNLLQIIDEVDELGTSNPTAVSELLNGKSKNYRFLTTVSLDGRITEGIRVRSVLGLNSNNLKEYLFIPDQGFDLMYNSEVFNLSKAQNSNLFALYNDNQVYYEMPSYSSNHMVRLSLGLRWQKSAFDRDWGIGKNTASDEYTNLQRGVSLLDEIGGANMRWNWGALYSNFSYIYKDRYLLNATVSGDISSRLGSMARDALIIAEVPVGLFYSIGGAWRVSEEGFMSEANGLEELKIRASYGRAGNDDIGETNAFNHYIVDQYRQTAVLIPGALANEELTFQYKNQLNIGLDLSLLANRLSLTLDYFNNKSKNLLLYEPQNSYLGYDMYPSNSASISTSGFEADIFYRLVSKNSFTVDIGTNFSKYSSIIAEIAEGEQTLNNFGNMEVINRAGEPVNSFYGYRFLGVYASQTEADEANLSSDRGVAYGAGDAIFENTPDAEGDFDQVIDKNDKQILGSFEPDFYGGIYLNVQYKNWSLNSFFQGVYGNEVFNYVRYQNEKMTDLSNQSVKVLQRWQYENQVTNIPKATWNDPAGNNDFSDRWLEDGSYLRLKNLTIGYQIKRKVPGISNLKVFLSATNLVTLSKYRGFDPEFSYAASLINQGVDYGNIPISRGFMMGVNIGL
ncbi:MAG: SusC/RagA family TonB-linked outer membrane protein [Bacteroidales bacterium]|nr:SusC/RagA family TonB-linked outer membrane protein [Bacteroidales bacterium]